MVELPHMRARAFGLRCFALLTVACIALWAYPPRQEPYAEGQDYFYNAEGNRSAVYSYYAGRVLHPWVARWASGLFGVSLQDGFRIVTLLSLLAFGALITLPGRQSLLSAFFASLTLAAPAVVSAYRGYYFQDLFYSALLAGGLLVLKHRSWFFLPFLVLLYLTRESTILVAVALIGLAIFRKDHWLALATAVTSIGCLVVVRLLVSQGIPDKHGLNAAVLYLLKVPYNASYNLLGLVFWTDTNAETTVCIPSIRFHVAHIALLGRIKEIGFCGFRPELPLRSALLFVTAFGISPALIWLRRASAWSLLRNAPYDLALAAGYGLLALLSAYSTGTWVDRYVLYAWPLFLYIPIRILTSPDIAIPGSDGILLLICDLVALWLPSFGLWGSSELTRDGAALLLAVGVQGFVLYRFQYLAGAASRSGQQLAPIHH